MNEPDAVDMLSSSSGLEPEDPALLDRRFAGVKNLYGVTGRRKIADSHVCVIGIGGVGSWVVESLARSAVGSITMIDMDIVSASNTNRQILATTDTIGRDKTAVMQERVIQINPDCRVTAIDDFITRDNLKNYLSEEFDFVIDCIDDFRTKAALLNYCKKAKIKVLCIGGAGGQKNPGKVRLSDLSRTQHDVLLAQTRKLLRQDYGFSRNLKRSFGVPCVYSDEQAVYSDGVGGLSSRKSAAGEQNLTLGRGESGSALSCAGGLGSISHVTATFAFYACAHVLDVLSNAK